MERLDYIVSKKLNISRTKAQGLIKEGLVKVNCKIVDKPSFSCEEEKVEILQGVRYVSRGAYKLLGAIEKFHLKIEGRMAVDIGASTGGFTQVLLENVAKKVYAVDVGHGELDKSLALSPKVVNLEGKDIRLLEKDEVQGADLVVGDLSFISLKHILPIIKELFGKIECVLLFKPQFECGKDIARKYKGVIKDKSVHKSLLKEFSNELKLYNFDLSGLCNSPIKGKEGNIEYLVHLNHGQSQIDIEKVVESAFK